MLIVVTIERKDFLNNFLGKIDSLGLGQAEGMKSSFSACTSPSLSGRQNGIKWKDHQV